MSDTPNVLLIVDYCGEADPGLYLIPDAPEWLRACDGLDLVSSIRMDGPGKFKLASDIGAALGFNIMTGSDGEWVRFKIETGEPVEIGRATIIRVQVTP